MCGECKCPACKGTGKNNHGIQVRCFTCNGTGEYKEYETILINTPPFPCKIKTCKNCKCDKKKDIEKS